MHFFARILCAVGIFVVVAGSDKNKVRRERSSLNSDVKLRTSRFVMFGTKWCGPGNKARHHNDLGYFRNVDKCCRAHDLCPYKIHRDKRRWGVMNMIGFTISDCVCDHTFHECLKNVDKSGAMWLERITARSAGTMFFNILQVPCLHIPEDVDRSEDEVDISEPDMAEMAYSTATDYRKPKAKLRDAKMYKKRK